MNTQRKNPNTTRANGRATHLGYAVGIRGDLTDGMRRRIMAVLRSPASAWAWGGSRGWGRWARER